ncbi:MAG: fasciclin domain-containing protein [Burkholderiaceae bacterium]|nr:fasciclin domain-containing protein [Burkholderiaceae bacterium]
MKMSKLLLSSALVAVALGGCATPPTPMTISDTAAATPQLSTLTKLIHDAGLTETLKESGPYTVFAPTDDAFKAVPAKTLDALSKDKALLISVLTYHVAPGKLTAGEMKNGPITTVQGTPVSLYRSGAFVTVESAVVTTADVDASNGVVHIVDQVLIPPVKK